MSEPVERCARIGVVQMAARPGDVPGNLARAAAEVARLAEQGADLVVLPELFVTGYDLTRDLHDEADPVDGPHTAWLVETAGRHDLAIATALLNRAPDGQLLDLALVVDGSGVLANASKQLLWDREVDVFGRRAEPWALAKTSMGVVGVAICYEAGFPEAVRQLAERGAEVIAVPAAFGRPRLYAWELLTRSRALENGVYVAAAGLTGSNDSGVGFAGHSRVVSPSGSILAGLGEMSGSAMAVVDLADVERARAALPYLADLADLADLNRAAARNGVARPEGVPRA